MMGPLSFDEWVKQQRELDHFTRHIDWLKAEYQRYIDNYYDTTQLR